MIETRAKSYEGFMTSVPCYAQLLQILFFFPTKTLLFLSINSLKCPLPLYCYAP